MYNLTLQETEIIDKELDSKLIWAKNNQALAEQLAMDATKLLSCTVDRISEYENKGFFKRCLFSFSGKTAQMQRDNQNDLISMQKTAWRYLQILSDRDILMSHSLITIKNNLETLAIKEEETREEITRFAQKVKERFNELNRRVDNLETDVNVLQWLTTIKVQDYDERYPYYIRLLVLIYDFQSKKSDNWNAKDIQSLQQAILNAEIERKDKITIDNFVNKILDEIEESSFEIFEKLSKNLLGNIETDSNDITEEISSPIFASIFLITDNYTRSDEAISILQEHLSLSKKDAIKKLILGTIEKAGVDTKKELMLQDIALDILACSRLIRILKTHKNNNTKIDYKKIIESKLRF